jgi:hypothetical protein
LNAKRTYQVITAFVSLLIFIGCGAQQVVVENDNIPAAYVDADGTHRSMEVDTLRNSFPHLLMSDGRMTPNDRCPVRKSTLNLRLPTLFVNGVPIGFC